MLLYKGNTSLNKIIQVSIMNSTLRSYPAYNLPMLTFTKCEADKKGRRSSPRPLAIHASLRTLSAHFPSIPWCPFEKKEGRKRGSSCPATALHGQPVCGCPRQVPAVHGLPNRRIRNPDRGVTARTPSSGATRSFVRCPEPRQPGSCCICIFAARLPGGRTTPSLPCQRKAFPVLPHPGYPHRRGCPRPGSQAAGPERWPCPPHGAAPGHCRASHAVPAFRWPRPRSRAFCSLPRAACADRQGRWDRYLPCGLRATGS